MKKQISLVLALLCAVSCAAIEGRETAGQDVDDATISTRIRSAYVADPTVSAMQVHVETMRGVVELSGFVDSRKAEDRAVELARGQQGVVSVRDELVIRHKGQQ
jgi:hyperosmotically inducible protein